MNVRTYPFAALLIAAGTASAQDHGIMGPLPGMTDVPGPATVCGHSFALRLDPGERVRKQKGPDFFLYYATAKDGPFLIYEGNFPQPHDDEIETGLPFPRLIAIHDNRTGEARTASRVRDRLMTGDAFAQACPPAKSRQ